MVNLRVTKGQQGSHTITPQNVRCSVPLEHDRLDYFLLESVIMQIIESFVTSGLSTTKFFLLSDFKVQ